MSFSPSLFKYSLHPEQSRLTHNVVVTYYNIFINLVTHVFTYIIVFFLFFFGGEGEGSVGWGRVGEVKRDKYLFSPRQTLSSFFSPKLKVSTFLSDLHTFPLVFVLRI